MDTRRSSFAPAVFPLYLDKACSATQVSWRRNNHQTWRRKKRQRRLDHQYYWGNFDLSAYVYIKQKHKELLLFVLPALSVDSLAWCKTKLIPDSAHRANFTQGTMHNQGATSYDCEYSLISTRDRPARKIHSARFKG